MIIVWTLYGLVILMIIAIIWEAWRKAFHFSAISCTLILALAALATTMAMGLGT